MINGLIKESRLVSYVQLLLDRDRKYIINKVLQYSSMSTKKYNKKDKKISCFRYRNCFSISI